MNTPQIQALMTGLVVLACVIGGLALLVQGINGQVGLGLLIIVAGYLGLDLAPFIPLGKNQRTGKKPTQDALQSKSESLSDE
ncbi:unnamed protein product [marine sediment metagenome]|uniref:Uncharacterized protein n=1 Tax=marine sediment metagenome TaxID=412755 RepID=X1JQZ1_9ZZZZ